jgi:hypothetical protein
VRAVRLPYPRPTPHPPKRNTRNHRFAELAKLIDPANEPKTDKLSILMEAIRFVQQTQLENSQLRQLNKFLEVRLLCAVVPACAGSVWLGCLC